jgi:toxin ParE1/3/4
VNRYTIKPKADQDLEEYADYLAREASLDVALRFLEFVNETFALLANHPEIGWPARLQHASLAELRVFRVTDFEHMLILYRPVRHGVEIFRVVHGSRNLRSLFRRRTEIE